jgi:hypothetical protein
VLFSAELTVSFDPMVTVNYPVELSVPDDFDGR